MPSQGNYAIGSLAAYNALPTSVQALYDGRYDTFQAAFAAIVSPLTGNFTCEQIADVTETGTATYSGLFAGYTLKITSRVPPTNGNPNTGYMLYINHFNEGFQFTYGGAVTETSNLLFDGMYIIRQKANSNDNDIQIEYGTASKIVNITIRNCLLDGRGSATRGINMQATLGGPCYGNKRVYNCKLWDYKDYCIHSDNWGAQIENCSVDARGADYGIMVAGRFLVDRPQPLIRNCVSFGAGTADIFSDYNPNDLQITAVASEDATGTITNIVPTDQFLSIDDTQNNYLRLGNMGTVGFGFTGAPRSGIKPLPVDFDPGVDIDYFDSGVLADGGVRPSYSVSDIGGYERGQYGDVYSIGCHEAKWVEQFESQKINDDNVVLA